MYETCFIHTFHCHFRFIKFSTYTNRCYSPSSFLNVYLCVGIFTCWCCNIYNIIIMIIVIILPITMYKPLLLVLIKCLIKQNLTFKICQKISSPKQCMNNVHQLQFKQFLVMTFILCIFIPVTSTKTLNWTKLCEYFNMI